MRRNYFKKFYFVFIFWLMALGCMNLSRMKLSIETLWTGYWIGFMISLLLGLYLLFVLGKWLINLFDASGSPSADIMVQVVVIMGCAALGYIGLMMNWLSPIAMIIAPLFAIGNLYRYLISDTKSRDSL